jgi:hypothetical protein
MEEIFGPGGLIARAHPEFERMSTAGNIAPDLWMKRATGAPAGPEALLNATRKALAALGSNAGKTE